MTQPSLPTEQQVVVDLTGLPDTAADTVRAVVDAMRQQEIARSSLSAQEWKLRFDAYVEEVASRATRYPAGFAVDDSRETIYEGRGEATPI
jgi:hypothetical protein